MYFFRLQNTNISHNNCWIFGIFFPDQNINELLELNIICNKNEFIQNQYIHLKKIYENILKNAEKICLVKGNFDIFVCEMRFFFIFAGFFASKWQKLLRSIYLGSLALCHRGSPSKIHHWWHYHRACPCGGAKSKSKAQLSFPFLHVWPTPSNFMWRALMLEIRLTSFICIFHMGCSKYFT